MAKKKNKRKQKLHLLNIKLSEKDHQELQKQANKFAGGNLSAWLRFAGKHFIPKFVSPT